VDVSSVGSLLVFEWGVVAATGYHFRVLRVLQPGLLLLLLLLLPRLLLLLLLLLLLSEQNLFAGSEPSAVCERSARSTWLRGGLDDIRVAIKTFGPL